MIIALHIPSTRLICIYRSGDISNSKCCDYLQTESLSLSSILKRLRYVLNFKAQAHTYKSTSHPLFILSFRHYREVERQLVRLRSCCLTQGSCIPNATSKLHHTPSPQPFSVKLVDWYSDSNVERQHERNDSKE